MRTGFRSAFLIGFMSVVWCVVPHSAAAEWPECGRAISTGFNAQLHSAIANDGADGAIIAWRDHRSAKINIAAQHVLASGEIDAAWPSEGRAMMSDTSLAGAAGGPFLPLLISDGRGGAIAAWVDLRDVNSDKLDIVTQHVLASGVLDAHWPPNGTKLVSTPGLETSIDMVSDGTGGAIVTWADSRRGELDVYAQHVLRAGAADSLWPQNGLAVCTAPRRQEFPAILEDGLGGAIIAWDDLRSSVSGDDIYAQHVLNSGVVDGAWPPNGRAICTASGAQGRPTIAPDGAHGAVVAWTDGRILGTDHIFAQHVFGSGAVDVAWPVNGRAISNAAIIESRPLAVSDGAGGAIVNWQGFTLELNIYVQHVLATGVIDPVWPAGGRALSDADRPQTRARIVPDGSGGAVIAWQDSIEVVAQHVLASGGLDPAYPDTGRTLCNLPSVRGEPAMVATGCSGAIVSWTDERGVDLDIYAVQVLAAETTGTPDPVPGEIIPLRARPNPTRGAISLHVDLDEQAGVRLTISDLAGRNVRRLVSGTRPAGEYEFLWDLRDDRGQSVGPGVYFVHLDVGGRSFTQRIVTLK